MPTVADLGQKVKAKYPGQYDDLPDDEVGRKVQARFPGQYDDFADSAPAPEMLPSHAPYVPLKPPREAVAGEKAPGFGRGAARGLWSLPGLVGLDYETAAAAEWAVRDPDKLGERGLGLRERFNYYQEKERERSRRGEAENPITTGLGIGVGAAPSTLVMPQAKAAQGASLGVRALKSALTTGAQSAAIEGGVTAGLPAEERLKRMAVAGGAGGALGAVAPVNSAGMSKLPEPRALRNVSPEARTLLEEGVPLTPGQRNPRGMWAQIEEAATSMPVVGPKIAEARGAARETWATKAFEKARAPGAAMPEGATPGEMVSSLRGGFNEAYSAAKGAMTPESVSGLPESFAQAVKKPEVLATDATRNEVGRFLKDQLSLLKSAAPTVEKLVTIRSNIRAAKTTGSAEARPLLRDAEQAVTEAITKGAPPEAAALLKQIDRQYPAYKTVSKASGLAKDQTTGMTPTHLSSAVKANTPAAVYEQGGGGPLREWAAAGKEVFDTRVPPTGARLLTMTPGLRYGFGAAAYLRAGRSQLVADKLATALRTNPEQFGANASALLGAAERGPEALAAAHYVLSLRSPEYRLHWNAAAQQEESE